MFKMVSSPHTHGSNLTAKFMLWVMVAMLPALVVQCYYFGVGVLVQVIIAVSFAVVIELTVAKLRRKPTAFYLADLSGIFNRTDFSNVYSALFPLLDRDDRDDCCLAIGKTYLRWIRAKFV